MGGMAPLPAGNHHQAHGHGRHPHHPAEAIPLIMQVLELMHQENLPLRSATASGFNLADAGTLAAYEVTLNAI